MNKRLIKFLRKLGLGVQASEEQAQQFFDALMGRNAVIAAALLHPAVDTPDSEEASGADAMLRGLGVDPQDPTRELPGEPPVVVDAAQNTGGTEGERGASAGSPDLIAAAQREATEAERQRVRTIEEIGGMAGVDSAIIQQSIRDGQTIEAASARFAEARAERMPGVGRSGLDGLDASAPAAHVRHAAGANELIAAMMMRHSINDPSQSWPDRFRGNGQLVTRDAAADGAITAACDRGHELVGLSMVEIASRALALDGIRANPTPQGIGMAIQEGARQGYGFANLTAVFTTSYTAVFMQGYDEEPNRITPLRTERAVRDYKVQERIRMSPSSGPELRKAMQEAKPVTFSDQKETYRVYEFANQFVFDQQNLIDDSFDALQDYVPADLGRMYTHVEPDLFVATLAANANMRDGNPLFSAAHGNLTTSAALGTNTLGAARTKMALQREGGRNLTLTPRHLYVPETLQDTAATLANSRLLITGENATKPEINPNSRYNYNIIADPRLDNGVIDPITKASYAGDVEAWYLFSERPMFELGYVASLGRNPSVRSSVLTQGRFGIGFDIQMTLGMKALDWYGCQKATAAS